MNAPIQIGRLPEWGTGRKPVVNTRPSKMRIRGSSMLYGRLEVASRPSTVEQRLLAAIRSRRQDRQQVDSSRLAGPVVGTGSPTTCCPHWGANPRRLTAWTLGSPWLSTVTGHRACHPAHPSDKPQFGQLPQGRDGPKGETGPRVRWAQLREGPNCERGPDKEFQNRPIVWVQNGGQGAHN